MSRRYLIWVVIAVGIAAASILSLLVFGSWDFVVGGVTALAILSCVAFTVESAKRGSNVMFWVTAELAVLLGVLVIWLSSQPAGVLAFASLGLYVLLFSVLSVVEAVLLVTRDPNERGRRLIPLSIQILSLGFVVWVALTNAAFGARFRLHGSEFERVATRVAAGATVETPAEIGPYRVTAIAREGHVVRFTLEGPDRASVDVLYSPDGTRPSSQSSGEEYESLDGVWYTVIDAQ